MKEKELKKIISMVCDDYVDALMVGIEESKQDFPLTINCANFLYELKEKDIILDFNDVFVDDIRDKIYKETINYLVR